MILDFPDTKGEILQKLENYRRLWGGLLRADNTVRLISDNVKYRKLRYIGWQIVELEVLRNEGEERENAEGDNGNKRKSENDVALAI